MLHAATAGAAREMIEKCVTVERAIIHPTGRGRNNFVQCRYNFLHVIIGGIGIDDHAKVCARLVEIGFREIPEFDWRVDQTIIICGGKFFVRSREGGGEAPSLWDLVETNVHGGIARVHWIHENLRQIEERVVVVELSAEGSGRVHVDLVIDDCPRFRAVDFPKTFVDVMHRERPASTILRLQPIHILSKVANLIKSIPYRKLELALGRAGRKNDLYLNEMLCG